MSPQLPHTLAAVLLEIGYLAVGVLLCYFGKDLLEKGIKGSLRGDGTVATTKFRIVTSSPGVVFMLAGLTVIGLAIVTQASFSQGPSTVQATGAKGLDTSSHPPASMKELADTVVVSRFAEPTPERAFALSQMEAARTHLAQRDDVSALLALTNAITVNPSLLKTAVQDPGMAGLTANPDLQEMVRARFKMPLTAQSKGQPDGSAVVVKLGIFAFDRRDLDQASEALRGFPPGPGREPVEATAARLRTSLERNPRALYSLLRTPDYQWVLATEALLHELRSGVDRLEASTSKR